MQHTLDVTLLCLSDIIMSNRSEPFGRSPVNYYHTNRHLCSVFEEMRECCKTGNYSYLPGLIEEAQSMGNRMEAGLYNRKDLIKMQVEWSELKSKIKSLRSQLPPTGNED